MRSWQVKLAAAFRRRTLRNASGKKTLNPSKVEVWVAGGPSNARADPPTTCGGGRRYCTQTLNPKLKAERRTASARPQQLHWCWRRASPAWRAEAPRVAFLCNERGLELSLPLPAPAGLRRSNPKPSTKRRVLLMNFIKAPYTKL